MCGSVGVQMNGLPGMADSTREMHTRGLTADEVLGFCVD